MRHVPPNRPVATVWATDRRSMPTEGDDTNDKEDARGWPHRQIKEVLTAPIERNERGRRNHRQHLENDEDVELP
jgi:hypothetical protein